MNSRVIAFTCIVLLTIFGLALWWRVNWLPYQMYVPVDIKEKPVPLLVVLHGTGGDARTTREWLGLDEFAAQFGFITLYPHSPDGQWDAGAGILEHGTGERVRRDDTGYIVKIIEEVARTHLLDREKVFVVGVSDGAAMAVRLLVIWTGPFRVWRVWPLRSRFTPIRTVIPLNLYRRFSSMVKPIMFFPGRGSCIAA